MGAGRRFGMVLDAEHRLRAVPHALHRAVVQIDAVDDDLRGKRLRIDGKTVVLGGDFDAPAGQILDGLVGAAMTELELERLSAEGLAENLVPQADAEHRQARTDEVRHGLDGIAEGGGIARSVAEEDAGGLVLQGLGRGRGGRDHLHPETALPQTPEDVVLDAEVVGHDGDVRRGQRFPPRPGLGVRGVVLDQLEGRALLVGLVPGECLGMRDFAHVIDADQPRPRARARHGVVVVEAGFGAQKSLHRPRHAQPLRQRPGVDALDARNAVLHQILREAQIGAPVAHDGRQLAHHEPGDMGLPRLHVDAVDPVIPDVRVGHRHDLPLVGRVGEDFLVAGHRGVEADLAARGSAGAEGLAVEYRPVFEGKNGAHRSQKRPDSRVGRGTVKGPNAVDEPRRGFDRHPYGSYSRPL